MSRLFFNLHECGSVIADPEGVEIADLGEARNRAVTAAREIMCAEVTEGRLCLGCSIEVQDQDGNGVLSLPFREAVVVSGM